MPRLQQHQEFIEQAAPGTPASGYVRVYAKSDGKLYAKDDAGTEYDLTATGGGSGSSTTIAINQTTHGLAVGDIVRHNGTIYVKAQADTEANAEVVGIVSVVTDANNFTLLVGGQITGLSGLTAGVEHYLSGSSAGALTATEPSEPNISKPVLIAVSTTIGYFFNFRGTIGQGAGSQYSTGSQTNNTTTADVLVPAGYSSYFADYLEIGDGFTYEIGLESCLEIG